MRWSEKHYLLSWFSGLGRLAIDDTGLARKLRSAADSAAALPAFDQALELARARLFWRSLRNVCGYLIEGAVGPADT